MGGHWMLHQSKRIAQALTGAGIAVLFVSVYAAANIYFLIPNILGFLLMIAITALGVVLSVRHGAPIALLGLVGGFLAPALTSAPTPHPGPLFIYLYLLFAGLSWVIRRQGWWPLAILAQLGAFFWVVLWLIAYYQPEHHLWLSLFIIAIAATSILTLQGVSPKKLQIAAPMLQILSYGPLIASFVLLGSILSLNNFALADWGFFAVLSSGCVATAYFDERTYIKLPWLAMAVVTGMMIFWDPENLKWFSIIVVGFGTLFAVSGYLSIWRSTHPTHWAALSATALVVFYLLAYKELREVPFLNNGPTFWGFAGFILAGVAIIAIQRIMTLFPIKGKTQQKVLASYAIAATSLINIGIAIEIDSHWLMLAISLETLAIAWLTKLIPITILRSLTGVLAIVFTIMIMPQAFPVIAETFSIKLYPYFQIPIVKWPLRLLGIPTLAFAWTSQLLLSEKDDRLVRALEAGAAILLAILINVIVMHFFSELVHAEFATRGFNNSLWLILAFTYLLGHRYFKREALAWCSIGLIIFVIVRIIWFDLLFANPLWYRVNVGSQPIINALWLVYALPAIILLFIRNLLKSHDLKKLTNACLWLSPLLLFTFINYTIRQIFQGPYLNLPQTTDAEMYTYSVVWVTLGLILLVIGIIKKYIVLRYISLALMALAAFKVFLLDSAELTGLFRVISFLGLGFSLLTLGYLYQKYVLADK